MSWDTERKRSGKKPWNWIEFEVNRCIHDYGNSPCTAQLGVSGEHKCYNSWQSCQDPSNFSQLPYYIRICEPSSEIPRYFEFSEDGLNTFLPLLTKIDHSPSMPDPGKSLGLRAKFTARLMDAPHHDMGIDKYVEERTFNPMQQGTFMRKLKARWPHYIGRKLRWYQGYLAKHLHLFLPGVSGNYVSTPDSLALDITGDIDIRVKVAINDWTPATAFEIIEKCNSGETDCSYILRLNTAGTLTLIWTEGGVYATSGRSATSSIAVGATDGTTKWLRATLDVDNGAGGRTVTFYTSDDGVTWVQLGTAQTTAGTTSIHAGNIDLHLAGTRSGVAGVMAGKFYYAEIRNGIDGEIVTKFDSENDAQPASTQFVSSTGEVWTIHQSGGPVAQLVETEAALTDFRMREFVMEKIEGPDARGQVSIICKDVLKLLDDDRVQCPAKSKGSLMVALDSSTAYTQIDITTTDQTEYDLKGGESVDYIRIEQEIFTYTGKTNIANGVRITGVTRTAPSPYVSIMAAHEVGDMVQRCRMLQGTIPEVVEELMVDYGGLSASYIPTADWTLEGDTWLANDTIQRLVTEPEGVKTLIDEIISQTLVWAFWFDEVDQEIKFRGVHPPDIDEAIISLDDTRNIVMDSVIVKDDPDSVINEIQILYAQINPVKGKDELENYHKGLVVVDSDSQSANEIGQRRIRRLFCRWHPGSNSAVLLRFAERTLAAQRRNLMTVEFELDRKDENVRTAEFADLTTLYLIDALGLPVRTRVQILRTDTVGERLKYKAKEDYFGAALFGRWAPGGLSGLLYDSATSDQKAKYIFWADSNGELGAANDPGKTWS